MAKTNLTPERLRELLHYCPETGVFTWLKKLKHNRPIGSKAGTARGNYLQIGLDQTRYYAHRLAWFWVNGAWPENQIDHINRAGMDNRIANLRDVSRSVNCRNTERQNLYGQGVTKNSGFTWGSKIVIGSVHTSLGSYTTAAAAESAFLAARNLHPDEKAMREFAEVARIESAKTVAATKLRLVVNGENLSVTKAAKRLGMPERTVYDHIKTGIYCNLQTFVI